MERTATLVLGLGNRLLADDGAGIHAIHRLRARIAPTPQVQIMDGGTLSFTLAGPLADAANLIVIDAAELQSAPGTVATFVDEDMDRFLGMGFKHSVHEVGLLDLMQIARLTGSLPERRALIGIQPERIGWGDSPSPAVQAALDAACERALELIRGWQT